jgi:RNA polymerase sigma factor (sigma-70 family)
MKQTDWPDEDFWKAAWARANRAAYAVLHDVFLAQEVAQDTIEVMYDRRATLRPAGALGFATTIGHNRAVSVVRQRRHEVVDPHAADTLADPTDSEAQKIRRVVLGLAFEQLAPDQLREIARLRFIDDLPTADIAARLGLSDGYVRNEVTKARKFLQEYLGEDFL